MHEKIKKVSNEWERLGEFDPFWAALTVPGKEHSWDKNDFIDTGKREIDGVMENLKLNDISFSRIKALDFGCGPGRLSIGLSNFFSDVVGVDVAKSMIDVANGLLSTEKNIRYVLNQKELLSIFDDDEFSFIYSNHVLQHIPKSYSLKYITEFHRVLASGGVVAFFLPVGRRKTIKNFIRKLMPDFLEPFVYRLRFRNLPQMEMNGVESNEIVNLAKKIGFEVLMVRKNEDSKERWQNCFYVLKKCN